MPERRPDGQPRPRVSVVTPSYNQGQFIEETIRSVLLQGYSDLEYIIIDGGSTDGSVDIIRKYEPWLACWVSEPDQGQTHAINKGWMRATGEILAYINTDDCYLNGAITIAVEGFRANPRAGMTYGTAIVIDEWGKELRIWEARPFDLKVMLTAGSIVPQPATFFSGNALRSAGYLDEKWHQIMDYEFCIRIGMHFPAVCVPGTLAMFRNHGQNKTRLHFEATARELLHFVTTLSTDQLSPRDWQAIKRATISRVHYELALAYLWAPAEPQASKAIKELLECVFLYPTLPLKRPRQTAYITKELLVGSFKALGGQVADLVKRMSW